MALISANTIIASLAFFHIALAFFFLTSPVTIADQALVWILGEAMGLVSAPSQLMLAGWVAGWLAG